MPIRHIFIFLAVTFAWSWGFWALPYLDHRGVAFVTGLPDILRSGQPAAWGPLVGAICAALIRAGWSGVWALLRRGLQFRFGWRWYLVIFLTFPVIIGGSLVLAQILGEPAAPSEALAQPFVIPVAFVWILLLGGPLQEEFGWRGTLLDPLQARFGALLASLAVGATWAAWHIPLFLYPNDAGPYYESPFLGLLVSTMLISVLFTWIYNNTGRSIAAMMLFHAMFNLSHWVFPVLGGEKASLFLMIGQVGVVAVVVLLFGAKYLMRQGKPEQGF